MWDDPGDVRLQWDVQGMSKECQVVMPGKRSTVPGPLKAQSALLTSGVPLDEVQRILRLMEEGFFFSVVALEA